MEADRSHNGFMVFVKETGQLALIEIGDLEMYLRFRVKNVKKQKLRNCKAYIGFDNFIKMSH